MVKWLGYQTWNHEVAGSFPSWSPARIVSSDGRSLQLLGHAAPATWD